MRPPIPHTHGTSACMWSCAVCRGAGSCSTGTATPHTSYISRIPGTASGRPSILRHFGASWRGTCGISRCTACYDHLSACIWRLRAMCSWYVLPAYDLSRLPLYAGRCPPQKLCEPVNTLRHNGQCRTTSCARSIARHRLHFLLLPVGLPHTHSLVPHTYSVNSMQPFMALGPPTLLYNSCTRSIPLLHVPD